MPEQTTVTFLLGVVLITLYSIERFNTPPSNRASTTALRYYSSASAYILIYIIAYFLLNKYPYLLDLLLKAISADDKAKLATWAQDVHYTVIVALLLSISIPRVAVLSKADAKVRKLLQNLAAIPVEALRLSKEIHDEPFTVPESYQDKVNEHLLSQRFQEQDIALEQGKDAEHLWTKIATLMLNLESWEVDTRFAAFTHEREGQLSRLRERYKRLTGMAMNCFNLKRQGSSEQNEEPMREAVAKFCDNFMAEADDLFLEICNFISQGVLKCKLTEAARYRQLNDMGFPEIHGRPRLGISIDQVIILSGILLTLFLVNFILFGSMGGGRERILLMVTMIATIYSVAVMCAVYPKERWARFRRKPNFHPPVAGYFISGLAAVSIGFPISLFFKTIIFVKGKPGLSEAINKAWVDCTTISYPWMLMAFVTAVVTGFLIDFKQTEKIPTELRRWFEGTIQAIATLLTAGLVRWWLEGNVPVERVPPLMSVLGISGVVGFVLGFAVPTWYRRSHVAREDEIPTVSAEEIPEDSEPAAEPLTH